MLHRDSRIHASKVKTFLWNFRETPKINITESIIILIDFSQSESGVTKMFWFSSQMWTTLPTIFTKICNNHYHNIYLLPFLYLSSKRSTYSPQNNIYYLA
ncbi:hypothetical protein RCL_jg26006.t1 [Rhizophagus clarus]|uniref:Uncharacterized protein n=1 Tax=Rhizophagus clarus TaxID=94130 RepID=A0A8H3KY86_9GLOM|nr:hypothetical protein RCL_jg26006.t1 [Rhizophagus clarus]